MIENYSRVQLLTDNYHAEGASKGDVGSVIEVYGNGDYEVEFSDENGIDFAQIVAREEELCLIEMEPIAPVPANKIIVDGGPGASMSSDTPRRKRLPSLK